jgi:hypothetical protein
MRSSSSVLTMTAARLSRSWLPTTASSARDRSAVIAPPAHQHLQSALLPFRKMATTIMSVPKPPDRSEATGPPVMAFRRTPLESQDGPARIGQVRSVLHVWRYGTPWIDEVHDNLSCHKWSHNGVLHGQDRLRALAMPEGSGALGFFLRYRAQRRTNYNKTRAASRRQGLNPTGDRS